MDTEKFFQDYVRGEGKNFLAGIVSIDIVGHSKLPGGKKPTSQTKSAFCDFAVSQLLDLPAILLNWAGDGGIFLFDISNGCDDMVLFADRIRHFVPLFNNSREIYNQLPTYSDISVRIVCHAGQLRNENNKPGNISGEALNILAKKEREIGIPGYVVLTLEVFNDLKKEIQDRLIEGIIHQDFSQIYILDGDKAISSMYFTDKSSNKLKDWIKSCTQIEDYNELLYFAYTNELLFHFLAYELDKLDVKILARNWVIERAEEEKFNKKLFSQIKKGQAKQIWNKAALIKNRATEINIAREKGGRKIDQKFYNDSPLFNGAILINKSGTSKAYIGISKWDEDNMDGDSPFKLDDWPAFELDSRDKIQKKMLEYLISRFREIWNNGYFYSEVCEIDDYEVARNPNTVNKIWEIDNLPYLIIIPGRHIPNRLTSVVAGEDEEASRSIEMFLRTYGGTVNHLRIPLPESFHPDSDWYPESTIDEIEKWPGHVIYICNLSIPPTFWNYLERIGFPYKISDMGKTFPKIINIKDNISLTSPFDKDPPEDSDYSLIAKIKRSDDNENNAKAFIIAGLNALGTWGTANFLTELENLNLLVQMVDNNQFGAVTKTELHLHEIKTENMLGETKLYIAPQIFQIHNPDNSGKSES